jgi:hypothetical protein
MIQGDKGLNRGGECAGEAADGHGLQTPPDARQHPFWLSDADGLPVDVLPVDDPDNADDREHDCRDDGVGKRVRFGEELDGEQHGRGGGAASVIPPSRSMPLTVNVPMMTAEVEIQGPKEPAMTRAAPAMPKRPAMRLGSDAPRAISRILGGEVAVAAPSSKSVITSRYGLCGAWSSPHAAQYLARIDIRPSSQ